MKIVCCANGKFIAHIGCARCASWPCGLHHIAHFGSHTLRTLTVHIAQSEVHVCVCMFICNFIYALEFEWLLHNPCLFTFGFWYARSPVERSATSEASAQMWPCWFKNNAVMLSPLIEGPSATQLLVEVELFAQMQLRRTFEVLVRICSNSSPPIPQYLSKAKTYTQTTGKPRKHYAKSRQLGAKHRNKCE